MREIMRSLLSSNLLVTGIIMFIGSLITFAGSTFLLNATNVGKRLGFLITGAAIFGWGVINSIFFIDKIVSYHLLLIHYSLVVLAWINQIMKIIWYLDQD